MPSDFDADVPVKFVQLMSQPPEPVLPLLEYPKHSVVQLSPDQDR